MRKRWRVFAVLAFILVWAAAWFVYLTRTETVTGTVIQLEETRITITGEKLTVFTLMDEATSGNLFLAVDGHDSGIELGDRLRVVYSKWDLAAHSTDPMGNRWNYWRVKDWKKL